MNMNKRNKQYWRLVIDLGVLVIFLSAMMLCNGLIACMVSIDNVFDLGLAGFCLTLLNLISSFAVFRYLKVIIVGDIKKLRKLKSSNNNNERI